MKSALLKREGTLQQRLPLIERGDLNALARYFAEFIEGVPETQATARKEIAPDVQRLGLHEDLDSFLALVPDVVRGSGAFEAITALRATGNVCAPTVTKTVGRDAALSHLRVLNAIKNGADPKTLYAAIKLGEAFAKLKVNERFAKHVDHSESARTTIKANRQSGKAKHDEATILAVLSKGGKVKTEADELGVSRSSINAYRAKYRGRY
jgi:hypothetical protein